MAKRSYKQIERNGRTYNMLSLPGTNFFKFEIINMMGSNVERLYNEKHNKNVFGISHFIEHLGFRSPKDYSTKELMKLIKNEGTYNASTDYDRINYWFQTTMDRIDLGIRLVANYTLNNLDTIPVEEFEIERKVVFNEAKRYADDDQTMFWFNSTRSLTGYTSEDNVIGVPETIATFTQEDCIAIKNIFLKSGSNVYNVTFDSDLLTENEVIDKIETELIRHEPLSLENIISHDEYMAGVIQPQKVTSKLENESEQAMTFINLDVVDNKMTADSGNAYLSTYAEETSLDDIIREQNGLTYGISFGAGTTSYKPYTYFGCDVSKGTEDQLMELFEESIKLSTSAWTKEAHAKFISAKRLKRTMSLLDQKNYGSWHSIATWYPEVIVEMKDILATDLDAAYEVMDETYSTFEEIGAYLKVVQATVEAKDYGLVTN